MRRFVCILAAVILCAVPTFGEESLKKRVERIETELNQVNQEVREIEEVLMSGTIIPVENEIDVDDLDPDQLGEVKGVTVSTEISNCDSATGWAASGTGTSLSLDTSNMIEGSGCIHLSIGPGGGPSNTGRAIFTKASGSWDLSSGKLLKAWIKNGSSSDSISLSMGESVYNEQGVTVTVPRDGQWYQMDWDISGIAAASKDATTKFAVSGFNNLGVGGENVDVYIDRIVVFGLSEVKAFLPEGLVRLFPNIFLGYFTSTNVNPTTIYISAAGAAPAARKGTPAAIVTIRADSATYNCWVIRHKDMAANTSVRSDGGAALTDGILSMGEGVFTVGDNIRVNPSGSKTIYFIALYAN